MNPKHTRLVDEGKISWGDPVVRHLPGFQLYDPYVTREMTIRDLLTHRSGLGLGAGDLLWWPPTDYSREEIVRRFRFVKPASSFRSRYAYDNVLYLVAGQVINAVTRQYDTFVARWRVRSLEADAFVTFALKPDGSIEQIKMVAVSPATDFSFDFHDLLFVPAVERKP